MQYRQLGRSDIRVSALCLGTMTWGEQNTEGEAHEQLSYALDRGINFIDTAEMYPVPPRAETQGRTEAYIGSWLKATGNRDRVILASKVAGYAEWLPHLRGGPKLDRANIEAAIDDSLKRLQTDYLDLYQLHWPDRPTNFFGQLGFVPQERPDATPLEETLQVMEDLVRTGKVRQIGLSNETAWGTMKALQVAENRQLQPVVSVQNPYNLLNRSYEVGLAEIAEREQVGLLAYSPMAFGVLSGKYLGGERPAGARLTLFDRFSRYTNPQGQAATDAYKSVADRHGLDLGQMSLAYVTSRPFVTANIIGATSMEQLKTNIDSIDIALSDQILEDIEAVHQVYTYPCP